MRRFVKNKLSIIIPTFNEADNVNKLIDDIIDLKSKKNLHKRGAL